MTENEAATLRLGYAHDGVTSDAIRGALPKIILNAGVIASGDYKNENSPQL